jgi:hypothetical protein
VFVGAKRVPTKQGSYGAVSAASFARVTLAEVNALDLLGTLLDKAGLTMATTTRSQLMAAGI